MDEEEDDRTRRRLRHAAAVLALLVAAIHLVHPTQGGHALLVYANVGRLGDPRPLFFALGSFALIFGVVAGFNGFAGRSMYLGGIAVTLAFLLGFGAWHTVLDHGAFWPHIVARPTHGANPLVVVVEHLLEDPLALVSALAELALLGCLLALYYASE